MSFIGHNYSIRPLSDDSEVCGAYDLDLYMYYLFYIALSSNDYWITGDYCNYVKNSKYWNKWGLHVKHLHNLLSNLRIVECTEFKHVV